MKSKKIISIVMASALMTSMFPIASYAETPTDVGTVVEAPAQETNVAQIGDQTYTDLATAIKALKSGDTLVLLADVTGEFKSAAITIQVPGITLDLNGHNVTNTYEGAKGIVLQTTYGNMKEDTTFKLVNSKEGATSTVTANGVPVYFKSGNSQYDLDAEIQGSISLVGNGGDLVSLNSSARLVYNEKSANFISNGGFKTTIDDKEYLYANFANAAKVSTDGSVEMTHNYSGSNKITTTKQNSPVVLDLQGFTYNFIGADDAPALDVTTPNVDLTVKNGKIISSGDIADVLKNNINLTFDNVQMETEATSYGIASNGTNTGNNLTLKNDSSLTAKNSLGIYWPSGDGKVTIDNSSVIAHTGVQICAGSLELAGDNSLITAVGDPIPKAEGDGGIKDGSAISIIERDGYKDLGTVEIKAGSFISNTSSDPIKAYSFNNTDKTEGEWAEAGNVITVSGGNFSEPIKEDLLADELTTMLTSRSNPEAPISYYASAQEASKNAQPGDKVESVDSTATTYTATIKFGTGAADLVYELTEGSSFNLPAAPTKNGYTFLGWTDGTNNYQAGAFIKLTGNMTIEAVWREIPEYNGKYSYEVFTEVGDNGSIKVDKYATEGDKITITVSPDEAYMLDDMTITSNGKEVEFEDNGDGTYTFTMPSGDVKIEVTFAEDPNWEPKPEEPTMPFNDVNENDWFYGAVEYVHDNGLMNGVSENEFAPQMKLTRAMMVSVLANLEGAASSENNAFSDVPDNAWYADAVNWAATVGVTNGFEDGTFRPNDSLTREQMAAMLYNYAAYKGYDLTAVGDLSQFADADQISAWAEDVVSWAVGADILHGMGNDMLSPTGTATRAEVAAVLANYCENVAK